jgi:hypothetical protein
MPNILEQISGLCDSGYTSDLRTNQQLYSIKKIAGRNPLLSVIAFYEKVIKSRPTWRPTLVNCFPSA